MSEISFKIVEASIESLDEFIVLLDEVGEWLWNKGVKQWKPGVHHQNKDKLAERVEHGVLILAYHREKLAGGCILSEVMPKVWPDAPNALSLTSFVVARFAAGKGLGTKLIKYCIQAATQRGKTSLRLDCWEGNEFLKSYYQRERFKMLDAIEAGGYDVRLFEKEVQIQQ